MACKGKLPYEVTDAVDLDSFRIQKIQDKIKVPLEKTNGETSGIKIGTLKSVHDEKDLLSNIIKTLNDTYGIDL